MKLSIVVDIFYFLKLTYVYSLCLKTYLINFFFKTLSAGFWETFRLGSINLETGNLFSAAQGLVATTCEEAPALSKLEGLPGH